MMSLLEVSADDHDQEQIMSYLLKKNIWQNMYLQNYF